MCFLFGGSRLLVLNEVFYSLRLFDDFLVDDTLNIFNVEAVYVVESVLDAGNPLSLIPLQLVDLLVETGHACVLCAHRLLELMLQLSEVFVDFFDLMVLILLLLMLSVRCALFSNLCELLPHVEVRLLAFVDGNPHDL